MWLWKCRASKAANAHFYAADYYHFRHNILTVFNVLSAISVLFFTNSSFFAGEFNVAVSVAGLLTVLSTALQYVMNYGESSNAHKFVGNEYSNMKRKIERLISTRDFDMDTVHRLSHSLNSIGKSSPPVKRALWRKSMQEFLREMLVEKAEQPSVDTWLAEVRARKAASGTRVPVAEILKARSADRR